MILLGIQNIKTIGHWLSNITIYDDHILPAQLMKLESIMILNYQLGLVLVDVQVHEIAYMLNIETA